MASLASPCFFFFAPSSYFYFDRICIYPISWNWFLYRQPSGHSICSKCMSWELRDYIVYTVRNRISLSTSVEVIQESKINSKKWEKENRNYVSFHSKIPCGIRNCFLLHLATVIRGFFGDSLKVKFMVSLLIDLQIKSLIKLFEFLWILLVFLRFG